MTTPTRAQRKRQAASHSRSHARTKRDGEAAGCLEHTAEWQTLRFRTSCALVRPPRHCNGHCVPTATSEPPRHCRLLPRPHSSRHHGVRRPLRVLVPQDQCVVSSMRRNFDLLNLAAMEQHATQRQLCECVSDSSLDMMASPADTAATTSTATSPTASAANEVSSTSPPSSVTSTSSIGLSIQDKPVVPRSQSESGLATKCARWPASVVDKKSALAHQQQQQQLHPELDAMRRLSLKIVLHSPTRSSLSVLSPTERLPFGVSERYESMPVPVRRHPLQRNVIQSV